MRPRKVNADLPRRVYERNGTFYYVEPGTSKWIRLTDDRSMVYACMTPFRSEMSRDNIVRRVRAQLSRVKARPKERRPVACDLTLDDAMVLLERAKWRCEVTGTPFNDEKVNGRMPFLPSIDRIDCDKHYTLSNCRIVCAATNIAMNIWGEPVLSTLFTNWRAFKG